MLEQLNHIISNTKTQSKWSYRKQRFNQRSNWAEEEKMFDIIFDDILTWPKNILVPFLSVSSALVCTSEMIPDTKLLGACGDTRV